MTRWVQTIPQITLRFNLGSQGCILQRILALILSQLSLISITKVRIDPTFVMEIRESWDRIKVRILCNMHPRSGLTEVISENNRKTTHKDGSVDNTNFWK